VRETDGHKFISFYLLIDECVRALGIIYVPIAFSILTSITLRLSYVITSY